MDLKKKKMNVQAWEWIYANEPKNVFYIAY